MEVGLEEPSLDLNGNSRKDKEDGRMRFVEKGRRKKEKEEGAGRSRNEN